MLFRSQKKLSFENFKHIIDKLPKDINLHFTGFSEPFFNTDCYKMAAYAKDKNFYTKISTTLYKASSDNINSLIVRKRLYDKVILHLPADNNNMNIVVDENYINNVERVISSLIPSDSIVIFGKKINPKLKFTRNLANISYLSLDYNKWTGRAGHLEYEHKINHTHLEKIKCSKNRTTQNVLLPNGDVVLCCMDWKLEYKLGNLLTQDYEDLHNSDVYKYIIKSMSDNTAKTLCWKCEYATAA